MFYTFDSTYHLGVSKEPPVKTSEFNAGLAASPMLKLTSPIAEAFSEQITISGCGSDASTNLVILTVRPSIFDVIISMSKHVCR